MRKAGKSSASRDFRQSRNGLREAILGLLATKSMTGYDLSRSYKNALQQIWYAPLGQVYPTLRCASPSRFSSTGRTARSTA
jgi:DNA-binding PadR family transcriptional regulator